MPSTSPDLNRRIRKVTELAKNPQINKILVHRMGLFHLILNIECWLVKSCMVPIKHNQPQPILPNRGEIMMKNPQINTTNVMTPQYIECQINAKFKARKMVGVRKRNKILERKLKENRVLISNSFRNKFSA